MDEVPGLGGGDLLPVLPPEDGRFWAALRLAVEGSDAPCFHRLVPRPLRDLRWVILSLSLLEKDCDSEENEWSAHLPHRGRCR